MITISSTSAILHFEVHLSAYEEIAYIHYVYDAVIFMSLSSILTFLLTSMSPLVGFFVTDTIFISFAGLGFAELSLFSKPGPNAITWIR